MNLIEKKAKAYEIAREIEKLNYAFQEQLAPLQKELQELNVAIYEEEQIKPEPEKAEDKK